MNTYIQLCSEEVLKMGLVGPFELVYGQEARRGTIPQLWAYAHDVLGVQHVGEIPISFAPQKRGD